MIRVAAKNNFQSITKYVRQAVAERVKKEGYVLESVGEGEKRSNGGRIITRKKRPATNAAV